MERRRRATLLRLVLDVCVIAALVTGAAYAMVSGEFSDTALVVTD